MTIPIPDISFAAIAPEITLTLTAILLLMMEVFAVNKGRDHQGYVALGGVVAAGYLITPLWGDPWTTFAGLYTVDNFGSFFKLVMLLAAGMTILISMRYNEENNVDSGEYYALILFTTVGGFFMASGEDMMTIFLGIEVLSISLYVLAGYTRDRAASNEASLKYFILGALSSGFLLYGMALVYGASGTTKLTQIGAAIAHGAYNEPLMIGGLIMMLIALSFKVAAVPFHMWTPDVYQGAPAPVAAFMSAGPKAAAFAAFIRIFAEAFPGLQSEWWIVLWVLAVATMTMGNVVALAQDNVKRMLAYSSIAHAGYILVGLTAASEEAVSGILFYLLAYTFMNIGAFAVLIVNAGKGEKYTSYADFAGLGARRPLLAATMTVMLISLMGIPGTAGFIGKFYIFKGAIEAGYIWLAVIGMINSVISVGYYLRVIVYMYFKEEGAVVEERPLKIGFSPAMAVALVVAVYGVLWIGILPGGYIDFAKSAFLSF
jgi:NADH-quinone oxidoreductase subunit N